jgi:hypothetical protein
MAFGKKELEEIRKRLEEQGALQEKINSSVSEYAEHLKKIAEIQANIKHISEQQAILREQEKKDTEKLKTLLNDRNKGTAKEISDRQKEIKLLINKIKLQRTSVSYAEDSLKILRETNDEYVEAAQSVNKINMGLKASGVALSKVGGLVKKGFGKLKGTGVFEMDKAIRMAGVEMGIISSTGKGLGQTLQNAADQTVMMGVGLKDLAKMQSSYSAQLGRSVRLSQEGLEAMGEIAAGTMLGTDGAAALVAEMDRFNISATDSRDLIEETVNMSAKMGVNSGKVLKNLQNNLKMANKYHFKGGIKGMASMAASAAKLNVDMGTTAGFADKLFDIEGAVEMSAQLNTMGGEWARLGDPMKLMFQARNDMEGLQESVANATASMADFNSETGEFEFSGLELHRMRELEKITGIAADEMAEMAKSKAKFAKIDAQLGGGVTPEMKEFIESTATFNKKSGQFEIKLTGEKKAIPIDELNESHEKMMMDESKALKKRAEESQTFDETLQNTVELMKQALLPVLEGLNDSIPAIQNAMKSFKDSGWIDEIKSAARTIGNVVGGAIKFLAKFPKVLGGGLVAVLGGALLWNMGKWYLNGVTLAKGFNSAAMGGGAGGGTGGGPMGLMGKTTAATQSGKGLSGKMGKFGKGMAGKGVGMGMAGMVGGMVMDYGRGSLQDPDSDMGKAMGVAGSALSGAGTGAMIGSVVPVIGTAVGAIIGGLIGGITSAVEEYGGPQGGGQDMSHLMGKVNDAILSDGKVTPIDSKDKVFEVSKPGGAFDRTQNSGPGTSKGGGTSNIHITFGDIMVKSADGSAKIDIENDSEFVRRLATKIKEALSKSANGGVLNPNPS